VILIIQTFISEWLKEIVVLFIIISLMDLMLPKGNMKRYINFIVGLLTIFVVINPFLRLDDIGFEFDQSMETFKEDVLSSDELSSIQNEKVKEIYIESLKGDIQKFIETNSNYYVSQIIIDSSMIDNKILIENLGVILSDRQENKSKSKIKVDKVNIDDENELIVAANGNDAGLSDLGAILSIYMKLDKGKIQITMDDKGEQYGKIYQ